MTTEGESEFIAISKDKAFNNRADDVFSSLGQLEHKYKADTPLHTTVKDDKKDERKSSRKRRYPSKVPDHVVNPQKWTKYSLEEDGSEGYEGGGDAINSRIALDFLSKLASRNKKDADNSTSYKSKCPSHVISKSDDTGPIVQPAPCGRNIHVMETYVVGKSVDQKRRKMKDTDKSTASTAKNTGQRNLSHLNEVDSIDSDTPPVGDTIAKPDVSVVTFKSKKRTQRTIRTKARSNEEDEYDGA